jgi:hypothetical protein
MTLFRSMAVLVTLLALNGCGVLGSDSASLLGRDAGVSQADIEQTARGYLPDSTVDSLQVELQSLAWVSQHGGIHVDEGVGKPDDKVYVVIAKGKLKPTFLPMTPTKGIVGASGAWTEEVTILLNRTNGQFIASRSKPITWETPGFRLLPRMQDEWRLGDRFSFITTGEPIAGSFTVSLENQANGTKMEKTLSFREAQTFTWPLDAENLPGFENQPAQTFSLRVVIQHGPEQQFGGELRVLK